MANVDVWEIITAPTPDIITKERTLIYPINIGISHTSEFGKCNFSQAKSSMGPHLHRDSFEICYHLSGRQIYSVHGLDYETRGGDVFIVYPNEIHGSGNFPEDRSEFFYFSFNCTPETKNFIGLDHTASDYLVNSLLKMTNRHFQGNARIKSALEDIMNIYFSDSPFKKILIQSLLIEYFEEIISCEKSSHDKNHSIPDDIKGVIQFIDENPHLNMTIEELASNIPLSVSRFKQKFKQYVGIPPFEYITRQRIGLSQEMLRFTQMPVTEIAMDLSFSSSQYFSKVFKKFTSMTPIEYRDKCRANRKY